MASALEAMDALFRPMVRALDDFEYAALDGSPDDAASLGSGGGSAG